MKEDDKEYIRRYMGGGRDAEPKEKISEQVKSFFEKEAKANVREESFEVGINYNGIPTVDYYLERNDEKK